MFERITELWGDLQGQRDFRCGWEGRASALSPVGAEDTLLWVADGEPKPAEIGWILRAMHTGAAVVFASADWGERSWHELARWLRPTVVHGNAPPVRWLGNALPAGTWVFRTGGSSGVPRFACHDADTLAAAVHSLQQTIGSASRLSFTGRLPLNHVSGFMPWWRAALTGGRYCPNPAVAREDDEVLLCSVVPTTLRRALSDPCQCGRLAACDTVLGGGAAFGEDLRSAAKAAGIPLRLVYGMTETAGVIAMESLDFNVPPRLEPCCGVCLSLAEDGEILIDAPQLFRRYLGDGEVPSVPWASGDLGATMEQGLQLLGRRGDFIHSGGETISLTDVAEVLLAHPGVDDAVAFGRPDPQWGERLEAVVAGSRLTADNLADLRQSLRVRLGAVRVPKVIHTVDALPRLPNGKLDGQRWRQLLDSLPIKEEE